MSTLIPRVPPQGVLGIWRMAQGTDIERTHRWLPAPADDNALTPLSSFLFFFRAPGLMRAGYPICRPGLSLRLRDRLHGVRIKRLPSFGYKHPFRSLQTRIVGGMLRGLARYPPRGPSVFSKAGPPARALESPAALVSASFFINLWYIYWRLRHGAHRPTSGAEFAAAPLRPFGK